MRPLLAVLLAGLFLILFLVAVTVNHAVDTASDPEVIIGMVNDAEAYDYVYDNIVANLVRDIVERGIKVDSGLTGPSASTVLSFDDSDAAAVAILALIETLVPRDYVKEKFEAGLRGLAPYLKGETNEFTIDLEVQERVRAVPGAVRALVTELKLTELVVEDLLVPQVAEFSSLVSSDALGINFTQQEIEETARTIFAPEWLEGQFFGAIDEITPYFAGDADSFNVVLLFDDRVVLIGQILKDKLAREDTLYNLVFAQVIDPLIQQTVAQSTSVGFGITLTEQEVVDAFEVIAPREWVREQGSGVIDALIDYMVGSANELRYTLELTDRKTAATFELQVLARQKLQSTLGAIPACATPAAAVGAGQDLAARQLPRCIAGGQTAIDLALRTFGPIMDAQVGSFVGLQVPDQLSYSLADFESQVGGGLKTVEDLRRRVIDGISFTEQDLIDAMAVENDPVSRADAQELLRILAAGVAITEKNIVDRLTPGDLRRLDDARGYAKTGLSLRWLLWVVVLGPLIAIGFIGGREWAGRLKWVGGVAVVCAVIVFAGIAIGWSFIDIAIDRIPDYETRLDAEFRASYPRLTAELVSDGPAVRLQRALDSWQRGWRNQTIPWIFAGVLVFAAGFAWPRVEEWRNSRAAAGPPAPSPGTSDPPTSAEPDPESQSANAVEVPVPAEDEKPEEEEPKPEQDEAGSTVVDPSAGEGATIEDDSDSATKPGSGSST
ncbi:MAG: hypothetical protein O6922_05135 [Chloroflexi bacterium]|nr:hypothetical protein [Chloroflexota bacterium]